MTIIAQRIVTEYGLPQKYLDDMVAMIESIINTSEDDGDASE